VPHKGIPEIPSSSLAYNPKSVGGINSVVPMKINILNRIISIGENDDQFPQNHRWPWSESCSPHKGDTIIQVWDKKESSGIEILDQVVPRLEWAYNSPFACTAYYGRSRISKFFKTIFRIKPLLLRVKVQGSPKSVERYTPSPSRLTANVTRWLYPIPV